MVLAAALFALGLAHPSIALPGQDIGTSTKAGKVHCKHVRAPEMRRFAEQTWSLILWERGAPKDVVIDAWHHKLHCAAGPGHRKAGKRAWGKVRHLYFEHRRWKIRQRERLRFLPYRCGGGLRSAIPCPVMFCESGGSYTAENPSGAYGKYQLMPEWWDHLGRKPTPAEQDQIASDLWDGGAGEGNWVCA